MSALTTSQLAKHGGINLQSIRFYEKQGLLPRPPRTPSGYRVFSDDSVRRVRFIKRAQELGFSLKEIKELLALRLDPMTTRAAVRRRAEEKQRDIEQKVRDLRKISKALGKLVAACTQRRASNACPIMESLDSWEPRTPKGLAEVRRVARCVPRSQACVQKRKDI